MQEHLKQQLLHDLAEAQGLIHEGTIHPVQRKAYDEVIAAIKQHTVRNLPEQLAINFFIDFYYFDLRRTPH